LTSNAKRRPTYSWQINDGDLTLSASLSTIDEEINSLNIKEPQALFTQALCTVEQRTRDSDQTTISMARFISLPDYRMEIGL